MHEGNKNDVSLSSKPWWRFGQAIFTLVTALLLLSTIGIACLGITQTDTFAIDKSFVQCGNGKSFSLGVFQDYLGVPYIGEDQIKNGIFTWYNIDAEVKVTCELLGRGEDPNSFSDATNALSFSELEKISKMDTSPSGDDLSYQIKIVHNYEPVLDVFAYFCAFVVAEGLVLLLIRGIARYTLIGKFF